VTEHIFFVLGFCFLLTHEMDAIRAGEWKVLPILSKMEDYEGYVVFTALHVPIYALLFLGLFGEEGFNRGLVVGLDVFFIVHAFLHLLLHNHPENRLRSVFSYTLILGAGVSGAIDLLLVL
jgi:hypothetical protein